LEDIVGATFSIDEVSFGAVEQIELIPNGSKTYVTTENRSEYVRLYIEYEFKK
jgi:hypothetical protein